MATLLTIETQGRTLRVTARTAELADEIWQHRQQLTRRAECDRLVLLADLPDVGRVETCWEPPPLPATLFPATHRRRRP